MFRILFGVLAGVFIIAPIASGDLEIDVIQISNATQTVLEKTISIIHLISYEAEALSQEGSNAL